MKIKFTKMHGCGNDYIYINCFEKEIENPGDLSKKLSNRRTGIGGDGVILICKSKVAAAKMRIFNADGSEGKMCGNGIRCVGKFLYDNKMVKAEDMKIETLSGVKNVTLCGNAAGNTQEGEKTSILKVNMGKPNFSPKEIPVKIEGEKVINKEININVGNYKINCVSMGNPHCVIFCKDVFNTDVKGVGIGIENSGLFPEGVNTEFIHINSDKSISMRVWERGSGETFACGTGACASVVAAVENGFFNKGEDVKVKLKGGELTINYTEESVYMTGPAQEVFKGEIEI